MRYLQNAIIDCYIKSVHHVTSVQAVHRTTSFTCLKTNYIVKWFTKKRYRHTNDAHCAYFGKMTRREREETYSLHNIHCIGREDQE